MHGAAKNIWLILIAVVLMSYANVVLKLHRSFRRSQRCVLVVLFLIDDA